MGYRIYSNLTSSYIRQYLTGDYSTVSCEKNAKIWNDIKYVKTFLRKFLKSHSIYASGVHYSLADWMNSLTVEHFVCKITKEESAKGLLELND